MKVVSITGITPAQEVAAKQSPFKKKKLANLRLHEKEVSKMSDKNDIKEYIRTVEKEIALTKVDLKPFLKEVDRMQTVIKGLEASVQKARAKLKLLK